MTIRVHCQICGRTIKTLKGYPKVANADDAGLTDVIAHHGYKRPHNEGWQSASCFGARWRPYEVACDAIPAAIKAVETHLANRIEILANWIAKPPLEIHCERRDAYGQVKEKWTVTKPDNFDVHARSSCMPKSYSVEYVGRRYRFEGIVRQAENDLGALKARLKGWKAPK